MATGKIKTLYSDKEKTEALFPRTKTSAVSDADGVGLDAIIENMVHVGDVVDAATAPLDADSLGGRPAGDYATQSFVTNKIAEAQVGGSGNIDLSGYATKDDLNTKLSTSGGTINGSVNMNGTVTIKGNLVYSDGDINMNSRKIWNLTTPTGWGDAANKGYVDDGLNTKAPSGHGLGTGAVYASSPDSVFNGGFYRWDTDNDQTPFANGTYLVIPRAKDTSAAQIAVNMAGTNKGSMAFRVTTTSAVGEWEYINPPMKLGTEYRTIKRFNNKVVYAKWIDFGALPSNTEKSVTVGVLGSSMKIIDYRINIYSPASLEFNQSRAFYDYADGVIRATGFVHWDSSNGNTAVKITTNSDLRHYNAYVYVEYTKD